MKHSLLLSFSIVTLLLSGVCHAQIPGVSKVTKAIPKVTVGLKIGANFQDLNSKSTWANSYKGGIVGGAFVGITKNDWGVQVEGLAKSVKYSFVDALKGSGANDVNTVYLDVPVLLEYRVVPRLWIQLGPQFSSLLSAKSGSTDVKSAFNTSDFSGILGLQVILPVHFVAGARYVLGFSDMNAKDPNSVALVGTDSWHNRSFQIYAGWRFL